MNIVLCGMMGAGKTAVGSRLGEMLGCRWVDTDALIVEKHGEIATIFERFGEKYFRGLETETVKTLVQEDGLVVSVGGGLVLKEENLSLLKENGVIVYLRATVETLAERLQGDKKRPLLQGESLTEKLTEMLKTRAPIYEAVADLTVSVEGKSPEEIAQEIVAQLKKK